MIGPATWLEVERQEGWVDEAGRPDPGFGDWIRSQSLHTTVTVRWLAESMKVETPSHELGVVPC